MPPLSAALKAGVPGTDTRAVLVPRNSAVALRLPSVRTSRREGTADAVVRAVVISRVIVWVAGLAVIALFSANLSAIASNDPGFLTQPFHSVALDKLVAPTARWDSAWYIAIAKHGYYSPQSSNFFPLYPLLMSLVATVTGSELAAGIVISVAAMVVGLALLYRLALLDLDQPAAQLTVALVALFPASLFLSAVYTESLFLALSVAAFYAARLERWAPAAICGALAAATRSNGVLVLLPLALLYLYGPRRAPATAAGAWWRPRYRLRPSAAWLLLVPTGLLAYMGYLAAAHGAPFAPFQAAQRYWDHSFAGPFGAVVVALGKLPGDVHRLLTGAAGPVGPGDPLSWDAHGLIDLGFVALAVVALIWSWRRVPFAYFAYAVVMLAYSLSFPVGLEPLQSISRYELVIFPLFMGVAARISGRRVTTAGVLAVSGVLLAVFSGLWAYWAWVA